MIAGRNDFFRLLFLLFSSFPLSYVLLLTDLHDINSTLLRCINLKPNLTTINANLHEPTSTYVNLHQFKRTYTNLHQHSTTPIVP